jgi:hypothetical protein
MCRRFDPGSAHVAKGCKLHGLQPFLFGGQPSAEVADSV